VRLAPGDGAPLTYVRGNIKDTMWSTLIASIAGARLPGPPAAAMPGNHIGSPIHVMKCDDIKT